MFTKHFLEDDTGLWIVVFHNDNELCCFVLTAKDNGLMGNLQI